MTAMAPEKVTVTVQSSIGESANLTVSDAMRQVLDFFELLTLAGRDDADKIVWRLVAVSMNSPLQVTAQAVAAKAGVVPEPIARREKAAVRSALGDMMNDARVPEWMNKKERAKAKNIFDRNLNGIGKTIVQLNEDDPQIVIVERLARVGASTVERHERQLVENIDDLSRVETGSIEATVLETRVYNNHPAIAIREWVTNTKIVCVFTDELAARIGPKHSWAETWNNRRVLLTGDIFYKRTGEIAHIYAFDLEDVDPRPLKYKDIARPNFTAGMSVIDYINLLREEESG